MREHRLTTPELALIVGVRAVTGVGLGVLLGNQLTGQQRRAVGITLIAAGALLTIPIAWMLYGNRRPERATYPPPHASPERFAEVMAD
jgi:uncharacterized membrane protein YfcA